MKHAARKVLPAMIAFVVLWSVSPGRGQAAPSSSPGTILLPEKAFNGGVLTGVVLGPDDRPLADTAVRITNGGIPGTLSGAVWGDGTTGRTSDKNLLPYIRCAENGGSEGAANSRAAATGSAGAGMTDNARAGATGSAGTGMTANSRAGATGSAGTGLAAGGVGGSPTGEKGFTILIRTDSLGRFAMCVAPDASTVGVAFPEPAGPGGLPPVTTMVQKAADIPTPQPPFPHQLDFVQPDQAFSLPGIFTKGSFTQNGTQGSVPVATAISADGSKSISTFKAPHNLQPGRVSWRLTGPNGQEVKTDGGVWRLVRATMDNSKLHSNQGADFSYEVQVDPRSVPKGLCVMMSWAGPIVMTKAPPTRVHLDSTGFGKFSGKVRATQVAPGSTVPFDIHPNFHGCE